MNIPNHPKSGWYTVFFRTWNCRDAWVFLAADSNGWIWMGFAWNSHPCYMDFPQNCMALEMEFNAGFNADWKKQLWVQSSCLKVVYSCVMLCPCCTGFFCRILCRFYVNAFASGCTVWGACTRRASPICGLNSTDEVAPSAHART